MTTITLLETQPHHMYADFLVMWQDIPVWVSFDNSWHYKWDIDTSTREFEYFTDVELDLYVDSLVEALRQSDVGIYFSPKN